MLMKLSSENKCTIVNVIHENPGTNKMRGHLGTISSQKASETIALKNEDGIFTVSCVTSRHKPFPSWRFAFENDELVSADGLFNKIQELKNDEKEANKRSENLKKLELMVNQIKSYLFSLNTHRDSKSNIAKYLQEHYSYSHGDVYKKLREIQDENLMTYKGDIFYIDIQETNTELDCEQFQNDSQLDF